MARKKKRQDTMSGVAVSGIMGLSVTGTMSGATGYGGGMSADYATGVGHIGSQLPTIGKIKGAGMVMSPMGNLMKTGSKMFKRRKRR